MANDKQEISDNDLHKIAQDIWLLVRNGMEAPHEQMNAIFFKLVAVRDQATKCIQRPGSLRKADD